MKIVSCGDEFLFFFFTDIALKLKMITIFVYFVIFCFSWPCLCYPFENETNGINRTHLPKRHTVKPPKPASWSTTRIVNRMCSVYRHFSYNYTKHESPIIEEPAIIDSILECPNVEMLVLGGRDAVLREYPHMAAIGFGDSTNSAEWGCSGTLVSDQFVLSAAHCANHTIYGKPKWIRLGDVDLNNNINDRNAKYFRITDQFTHPKYRPPDNYHDIALFKLSPRVAFSAYIRPVCLSTEPYKASLENTAIITGYGYKDEDMTNAEAKGRLRTTKITIFDNDECETYYNTRTGSFSHGFDSSIAICAGDKLFGNDTCEGDSGGPLQIRHENGTCMYLQIGVTSRGPVGCTPTFIPSVYTNVSYYIKWIQELVWPTDSIRLM